MQILFYHQSAPLQPRVESQLRPLAAEIMETQSVSQAGSWAFTPSLDLVIVELTEELMGSDLWTFLLTSPVAPPTILLTSQERDVFLYDRFFQVLPYRQIESKLLPTAERAQENPRRPSAYELELAPAQVAYLEQVIKNHFALNIAQGGQINWKRAIQLRMETLRLPSAADYLSYLEEIGEEELRLLVQNLTIPESAFFRTQSHYEIIRNHVLPELLRHTHRIRVWSSACATGEEPYSLAICLEEARSQFNFQYSLLATDLNFKYIQQAQRGIYTRRAVRNVPLDLQQKYFTLRQNRYHISEDIKSKVEFEVFNLNSSEGYFSSHRHDEFDLILCENVLIYFPLHKVTKVIRDFHRILRQGGYLFLGYSESLLNLPHKFLVCSRQNAFYYQKNRDFEKQDRDKSGSSSSNKKSSKTTRKEKKPSRRTTRWKHSPKGKKEKGRPYPTGTKKFSSTIPTPPPLSLELIKRNLSKKSHIDIISNESSKKPPAKKREKSPPLKGEDKSSPSSQPVDELIEEGSRRLAENQLEQAAQSFRQALESDETCPQAVYGLITVYLRSGRWEEAEKLLSPLYQNGENSPEIYYLKGLYYKAQHSLDKSRKEFEKAVYLVPTYIPAHFQLGEIFATLRKRNKAEVAFRNILKYLPQQEKVEVNTLDGVLRGSHLSEICRRNLRALESS